MLRFFFIFFFFIPVLLKAEGELLLNPLATGMKIQKPTYAAYSGDTKLWEIQANQIQGNPNKIKATGVKGVLWRNGKKRYALTSPSAYINLRTNDIFFPEGAKLENKTEEIRVRLLLWKAKEKKFFGTKGVVVTHLNTRLRGDSMVLDQTLQDIRLKGHVKADILPW